MNPALSKISDHMRNLGLAALAHANRHSAYYNPETPMWAEMSVLQAAHAAEILIKSCIAQEHPLLIFEHLPKNSEDAVSFESLFQKGRTFEWQHLPDRLWATTGITIPNLETYTEFGKLRNGIQHFASPPSNINLSEKTLRFVFDVIDPFIHKCWGLYAIDFDEDDASGECFPPVLINYQIEFLISQNVAINSEYWSVDWTNVNVDYRNLITKRIEEALRK